MKTKKDLIITLIQQDLKHSQLVYGLEKLGFDNTGIHFLEISPVIA